MANYVVLKAINATKHKPTWDYVASVMNIPLGQLVTDAMNEKIARFFADPDQQNVHPVEQFNHLCTRTQSDAPKGGR